MRYRLTVNRKLIDCLSIRGRPGGVARDSRSGSGRRDCAPAAPRSRVWQYGPPGLLAYFAVIEALATASNFSSSSSALIASCPEADFIFSSTRKAFPMLLGACCSS